MTDRYIVTNSRGEPIIHTNSLQTAENALRFLRGELIDTTKENAA
ncbi:hypothetical protein [Microbacterium telephonicum]|uniref:Uncharacterized protein n=1 Tax=Microbacterium telephonicum TaxID=1714841 RepID=A0A498BUZ2_9MICO|nr:hypothetical protein [Microbacterium telephonicum]RLK47643.1 hypothetical protein C7474_2238 [Microbacterium telephonicum]